MKLHRSKELQKAVLAGWAAILTNPNTLNYQYLGFDICHHNNLSTVFFLRGYFSNIVSYAGLVDAHNGDVERTWNNIQKATIPAIFGNANIGKRFQDIEVFKKKETSRTCFHKDPSRRVEVSTKPYSFYIFYA